VIWGLFGVIVGVFLEIRECFWTICGVFLAVSLHKLPKSFPQSTELSTGCIYAIIMIWQALFSLLTLLLNRILYWMMKNYCAHLGGNTLLLMLYLMHLVMRN